MTPRFGSDTHGLGLVGMTWPMALIVASFVVYHIAVKAVRADLHPLAFLVGVYGVALVASVILWRMSPNLGDLAFAKSDLIWGGALGLALVGIEFGFIMAYRAGWPVAVAPTFSNVSLAIVMAPVGVLLLHERVSWQSIFGLFLCVSGLILMTRFQP